MTAGKCPPRVKILALLEAGRDVPHLRECEECRTFADAASKVVRAFRSSEELETALSQRLDDVLATTPARRWYSAIASNEELHRSAIVRELLRRADKWYGIDPRLGCDMSAAAVALCDVMISKGIGVSPGLLVDALKEHAMLLCRTGGLRESERTLERAVAVVAELPEHDRECKRATLMLCRAIVYAEPDLARFDEALDLTSESAAVLALCDERRALIAYETRAYVLHAINRFSEALAILHVIIPRLEKSGSDRDAASAHGLAAHCLVEVGDYGSALQFGRAAERRYRRTGDTIGAARALHTISRARAASGEFDEVRGDFEQSAEVVFRAKLFDLWSIMRLDYVAAALKHDERADVRGDVEAVARVALTLDANESTQRRRFAAEAIDYLRMIAMRDVITREAVDYVRSFVVRNAFRPPVRFTRPPGGAQFLM